MLSRHPEADAVGSISPFRAMYGFAYRRIWSSRNLRRWESVFWIALAVYLGFRVVDYTFFVDDRLLYLVVYWFVAFLTPFIIGAWVHGVHVAPGRADESLWATPLAPSQLLWPRFVAIGSSWLRLFAPLLILLVVSHEVTCSTWIHEPLDRLILTAYGHLTEIPYLGPSHSLPEAMTRIGCVGTLVLALCQAVGWVTLPIAWGLWWGSSFHRQIGAFLFTFMGYLFMPAFLFFMTAPGIHDLFTRVVVGLSGLAASALFFAVASTVWGRREE